MSRFAEYIRAAFWIALFALIFGAAFYIVDRATARPSSLPDHRIQGFGRSGLRAWAELLRRQSIRPQPWNRRLTELSDRHGAIVIMSPSQHFIKDEVRAFMDWVNQGGTALIAPSRNTFRETLKLYDEPIAPVQQLLGPLGLTEQRKTRLGGKAQITAADPLTRDVSSVHIPSHLRLEQADAVRLAEEYPEAARSPYFQYYLTPLDGVQMTTLAEMDELPSVILVRYGRGRIVVMSEADMLANRWIDRADNVVLATNFAYICGARTIYFDEYHKGVSLLSLQGLEAVSSRVWQILVFALGALGLYFMGRMVRFGRPVTRAGPARHSAREVIGALAGLYQKAGATDAVIETIGRDLRRKLARFAHTAITPGGGAAQDERLATMVAGRNTNLNEATLNTLLRDFRAAAEKGRTLTGQQMLRLARLAADVEKELEDRGR